MLLKIKISKALPAKSVEYGTSKNILEKELKRNLFSKDLTPAQEMIRTAQQLGKWKDTNSRKTFSIVISPDPKDNPTEEQLIDVTNAVLDKFFTTNQGVIVLHKDKQGTADANKYNPLLHSHFFGSVINPLTGKNLHLSQKDLNTIRKWADDYAQTKYGWTPLTRNRELNASKKYKREVLRTLNQRGLYSWRLSMAAIIEKQYTEATSFTDFISKLQKNGISVFFSRKDRKTGTIVILPELMFSFNFKNKTMVVKATTISNKLTFTQLGKRFPEIGEEANGKNWRYSCKNSESQWLGKGFNSAPTRENSGQGHIGKSGRIDYNCLFCSHDKLICKDCSRDEIRKGGSCHERNGRAR